MLLFSLSSLGSLHLSMKQAQIWKETWKIPLIFACYANKTWNGRSMFIHFMNSWFLQGIKPGPSMVKSPNCSLLYIILSITYYCVFICYCAIIVMHWNYLQNCTTILRNCQLTQILSAYLHNTVHSNNLRYHTNIIFKWMLKTLVSIH